jgi:hypothetical protein
MNKIGTTVNYERCGEIQTATIIGWDVVSGPRGLVSGEDLNDPRYLAKAPNGMRVAICESDIR